MASLDTLAQPASPLGGIAQLLQALSPIFLGTGQTTQNQSQNANTSSNQTGASAGTEAGTTTSSAAPNVIEALLSQMGQATDASQNQNAVDKIIQNIIQLNAEAFTPTIGSQNNAGLYNSSTLALLSDEAQARSTAQAASTALNYRTTEQQIAAQLGQTLAGATKTQTTNNATTGNTSQQSVGQTATTGKTTTQTGPVVGNSSMENLLIGALGLGGSFLLNKTGIGSSLANLLGLGGSDSAGSTPSDLIDSAGNTILPPTPPDVIPAAPSIVANPNDVVPANAATGATTTATAAPQVSLNVPATDVGTPIGVGAGALTTDQLGGAGISIAPTTATEALPATAALPGISDVTGSAAAGDLTSSVGTDAGVLAGGLDPNNVSGGALSDALSSGSGGINGFLTDTLGLPSWLGTNGGSIFNLPSDIGNLFSGVEGAGSSVLGDIAGGGAGILGGFGGGLLDKAIGGNSTGSSIGSTIGGLAGSFLGPIGSLLGAFGGSLLGGLFGGPKQNEYSSTRLTVNGDGTLSVGPQSSEIDPNASSQLDTYQQQVSSLNSFLTKTGLKIANPTGTLSGPGLSSPLENTLAMPGDNGFIQLGDNTPGGYQDPTKFSDLTSLFPQLQFTSDNPQINALVSGQSFAGVQNLYNTLNTGKLDTGMQQSAAPSPADSGIVSATAGGNTSSSLLGGGVSVGTSDQQNAAESLAAQQSMNYGGGGG